uniref:Secreted protein n=1 Tax=Steinernema glaseri TaxID=37863 RepID=A0A1I8A8R9_9BILA
MMRKIILALFVVSAINAYPQGNEEGPTGQESTRRRQFIQPFPGAAQGPVVAAAPSTRRRQFIQPFPGAAQGPVVAAAPVVPAIPVAAAPAVVAAPLGQCPGGPSLPVECDPKRPWPQCPPQSYCYATNSVDIGPYFCCPIWSTYGAAWRPAAPFYNYVPPMPANWPDVMKVTANWPAAAVGLPVMSPIRKSKKQQNFNNDETTNEQKLIDSSMNEWLSRQTTQ